MTEFSEAMRVAFEEGQRAFNAGDFDRAFATLPDHIDWRMGRWIPDAGNMSSREEVIEFYRRLKDVGDWRLELIDVEDLGDGNVLLEQRGTWTGRSSGIGGDFRFFQLWTIADGKAVRLQEFETRDEALAALRAEDENQPDHDEEVA